MSVKIVREHDQGIYVWRLPDGTFFNDGDGHYLLIRSNFGDIKRMARLRTVAEHYGATEGTPVFLDGNRPISDEEYDLQMERMLNGEIADPYDVGALKDDLRRKHEYGQ